MEVSAKRGQKSFFSKPRPPGIGAEHRLRTGWLLMVFVAWAAVAPRASAIFVSPARKQSVLPTPAIQTGAARPRPHPSSQRLQPEDINLREQLQQITPVPVQKRKTNSNTFTRMSGRTQTLKPVVVPATSVKGEQARRAPLDKPPDPPQRLFTIGSWAFILACLGAAALGLLKIKKLTSSS